MPLPYKVEFLIDQGDDLWAPVEDKQQREFSLGGGLGYKKGPRKQYSRKERGAPAYDYPLTISSNMKTGCALSFLIGYRFGAIEDKETGVTTPLPHHPGTCHPTFWCRKHCYARIGQQSFKGSIAVQHKNSLIMEDVLNESDAEITRWADFVIVQPLKRAGYDNLKFNAVGDFDEGSVKLFNVLAANFKDMHWWGFSRKADMVTKIKPADNVHVNISLDPTTPGVSDNPAHRVKEWEDGVPGPSTVEDLWDASKRLRDYGVCEFVWADSRPASPELQAVWGRPWAPRALYGFHGGKSNATDYKDPFYKQFYTQVSSARVSMMYADPYVARQCPGTIPAYHGKGWRQNCRWCISAKMRQADTPTEQYKIARSKYYAPPKPKAKKDEALPGEMQGVDYAPPILGQSDHPTVVYPKGDERIEKIGRPK